MNSPVSICHTSGSTGNPKPIRYTNRYIGNMGLYHFVQAPPGRTTNIFNMEVGGKDGDRCFCAFPTFHLTGVTAGVGCLLDNRVQVRGPVKQSSSGKLVTDAMALMDIHCIYGPPMIFDDIVKSHSDDFNKYAGNTKMALFAGARVYSLSPKSPSDLTSHQVLSPSQLITLLLRE
jgi:acyl-CoA synthetase (AMP-forming)/AMP-acid ligase II